MQVNGGQVTSTATITGRTHITGDKTRIGEGAVVRDSWIENAVVGDGAIVVNSILVTRGAVRRREPGTGFGAKWLLSPDELKIGANCTIENSVIENTSVGALSSVANCAVIDSTIGEANRLKDAYVRGATSRENVVVEGPTEVSGSWLGAGTYIDRCGFYCGLYSNDFYIYEFNRRTNAVEVKETVEIPHVSRYGMNLVDSGHSGSLADPEGGVLKGIGPHIGLWHTAMGRGAPLKHSPLCLVGGWTKVVGKPCPPNRSADDLIQNTLATYLMPFSVSGFGSDMVMGQAIVGERNNGFFYKDRTPAWTFSYAPGAVIDMVRRLTVAGADGKLADDIVRLSLKNALALVDLYAHQKNIDPASLGELKGKKGWKGWLAGAREIYEFHLHSGLWEFTGGEPVSWKHEDGRWLPKNDSALLDMVPNALESQVSEDEIVSCSEEELEKQLGAWPRELAATLEETVVDPGARVAESAWVGPGVQVTGKSVVGENVKLYRTIVSDSTIEDGVSLQCSAVESSTIEKNVFGRRLFACGSRVGAGIEATGARLEGSEIASCSQIFPFTHVVNSAVRTPCIMGTTIRNSELDSFVMTYHMAGCMDHMRAKPVEIELDGEKHLIETVPMLGGGMRILGAEGREANVSCCFVGSNTIIEAGALVGFGCFVTGRLTNAEGLPPFTVSSGQGPDRDLVGAVLSNFPQMLIADSLQWNYQYNDIGKAGLVARMIPCMIEEGRDAVKAELVRRDEGTGEDSRYASLRLYTSDQLQAGLRIYETELSDGRWETAFVDGELVFTGNGSWTVKDGAARWVRA